MIEWTIVGFLLAVLGTVVGIQSIRIDNLKEEIRLQKQRGDQFRDQLEGCHRLIIQGNRRGEG